jgi:SAM-dependent methyltransferase
LGGLARHRRIRATAATRAVTDERERAARLAQVDFDVAALDFDQVRVCNLCGAEEHAEVARRDRYGFPVRYVMCIRCGLGFLSPRPTAASYARFYAGVYRPLVSAYHGRPIDAVTLQREQRQYGDGLVAFLDGALPARPATVLDVGGSTGVVGATVGGVFNASITVLDPSPDELAVAAEAGMATVAGFAETADLGSLHFDLVLVCQTLDHLLDVATTLAGVRSWLAPAGRAFVDILDVDFVAQLRGGIEGAVKIDHPYYLTRKTATAFFDRAGFSVVRERLSDDGHWGFLLAASNPVEPNWSGLERAATRSLHEVWHLRARS